MAYGDFVIQRDLSFDVARGEICVVMGPSGCGKSTLLRHLIGLIRPAKGDVLFDGESFWGADDERRQMMVRRFGVLYQSGALWSSMTLSENIGLPLEEFTDLTPAQIAEVAALKLSLVGLGGFEDFYPSEISGGMQKRAGLAQKCSYARADLLCNLVQPAPLLETAKNDRVKAYADGRSKGGQG